MEKMLSTWIEDQKKGHMPVSMVLVQAKAHSFYEDCQKCDDNVKLQVQLV
jgi:Tc5 transposase DNA-binding domain.